MTDTKTLRAAATEAFDPIDAAHARGFREGYRLAKGRGEADLAEARGLLARLVAAWDSDDPDEKYRVHLAKAWVAIRAFLARTDTQEERE